MRYLVLHYLPLLFLVAACDATLPDQVMEDDDLVNQPAMLLYTGSFVDKGGQKTSGGYRIERSADGLRLVLDNAFRTDDAPDLHVVLSPLPVDAAGNTNATEGSAIVASLKARGGVQLYPLSDSLDLTRYKSVLIHCVRYRHLFGAAPLTTP